MTKMPTEDEQWAEIVAGGDIHRRPGCYFVEGYGWVEVDTDEEILHDRQADEIWGPEALAEALSELRRGRKTT